MSDGRALAIGEVIALLKEEFPDVSISKLRFLESQGLLRPSRSPVGLPQFRAADVERAATCWRQQRDHFLPLKVIKAKLSAWEHGREPRRPASGPRRTPTSRAARCGCPRGAGSQRGVQMNFIHTLVQHGVLDARRDARGDQQFTRMTSRWPIGRPASSPAAWSPAREVPAAGIQPGDGPPRPAGGALLRHAHPEPAATRRPRSWPDCAQARGSCRTPPYGLNCASCWRAEHGGRWEPWHWRWPWPPRRPGPPTAPLPPLPIAAFPDHEPPTVAAGAWAIYSFGPGRAMIWSAPPDQVRPPASVTKLMTASSRRGRNRSRQQVTISARRRQPIGVRGPARSSTRAKCGTWRPC